MAVGGVHQSAIAVRVHTVCIAVELMISGHMMRRWLTASGAKVLLILVRVIARLTVMIVRLVRSLVGMAVVMIVVMVIRMVVAGRVIVLYFRYCVAHVHGDVLYKMILAAERLGRFRVFERDERERAKWLRNENIGDLAELLEVAAQIFACEILRYPAHKNLAVKLRTLIAELLFALAQRDSHIAPAAENVVAFGDHSHLRIEVAESHKAEALRLARLGILFDLHHNCFAELVEILFKLIFGYFPW